MLHLDAGAIENSTHSSAIVQALAPLTTEHSSSWNASDLNSSAWLKSLLNHASSEPIKQETNHLESELFSQINSKNSLLDTLNINTQTWSDRYWLNQLKDTQDFIESSFKAIKADILKPEYASDSGETGINVWMNNQLLVEGLPAELSGKDTNRIKFSLGDNHDIKIEYQKDIEQRIPDNLKTALEQAKKFLSPNTSEDLEPAKHSTNLPSNLPEQNQPPLNQGLPAANLPSLEDLETRITASVRWDQIEAPANDLGFGLNAYQGFRVSNLNDPGYQKNLSQMSPGIIRFHNAGMMDDASTTDGLIDQTKQMWDAKKVINGLAASYASFAPDQQPERMINIPGWPSWMDVNADGLLDSDQYDNYAKLCAELVRVVNQESNFNVKYWEITNEKDDQYFTHFRSSGGWGGLKDPNESDRLSDLITIYNKVAIAMKDADPTIQVGGPGLARSDLQPFYIPFIQGTAKNLDFFTYHYYATGSASTPDQDIYEATNAIGDRTATMVKILNQASPNREIPVILGEYNISWTWETRDPRMTNHKGVVFDALSMVRALKNGATSTLSWNEKDGVYGKTDQDNTMRLGGTFLQLMNQHLVGDRVATTTSNEKAVTTYAVSDRELNEKSYLIINHSGSDQKLKLDFGNWSPKQDNIHEYEISASGYSNKTVKWSDLKTGIDVPIDSVTLLTFTD